jgi:UDP-GlcNAc3NAcA epimerase
MKVVTILGARPQFIKAAVVSPALRNAGLEDLILDTGQHYDRNMAAVFFDELNIPQPTWSLGIGSASHGRQTAAMLSGIEEVLLQASPEVVLVYGDTNSTLAGALAAAKLHMPIAHVEAGLRSFNRNMPEEVNRVVTDHCSSLLFAPTVRAVSNLEREGISGAHVQMVGDVMYDLALLMAQRAERSEVLDRLGVRAGQFVLATVHRAENTDDVARFNVIVDALRKTAGHIPVVWPVHPRTRSLLEGQRDLPADLQLIDPVGYLDMMHLERSAAVVVTDSGGVQKEAFFHATPCVTLRDQTEWVELVELGWNRLVSPVDPDVIATEIHRAIGHYGLEGRPYGDGDAGERMATLLAHGVL